MDPNLIKVVKILIAVIQILEENFVSEKYETVAKLIKFLLTLLSGVDKLKDNTKYLGELLKEIEMEMILIKQKGVEYSDFIRENTQLSVAIAELEEKIKQKKNL